MAVATAIAAVGAAAAVAGTVSTISSQKKAANLAQQQADRANTNPAGVDINALDAQARGIASKNAADSAALQEKYNPGVAGLRTASTQALTNGLSQDPRVTSIADQVASQAGRMPTGISYDSPLLRDAIARARGDLTLGGSLDKETQNQVARKSLAMAGNVQGGGYGGLNLGRDITARDLGLTSLQLENQRLQNAASLGGQEAALGQGNANLSLQAQLAGTNNLFNSANFLSSLDNGQFSKALSASQLSQNIAAPQSGLDPGSVANLAVGNSNAQANQQQNAAALQIGAANNQAANYAKLAGTGLGFVQNYLNTPNKATYVPPPVAPAYMAAPTANTSYVNPYMAYQP